jgi:hypothetical protein
MFVTVPDVAPASHLSVTLKLLVLVMLALSSSTPIGEGNNLIKITDYAGLAVDDGVNPMSHSPYRHYVYRTS